MKFNWGTGIFLFYTIFALSLVFQVIKSTQYDNSLVVDDYYEADINYQAQYERKVNAAALSAPVDIGWRAADQSVVIQFPPEVEAPTGSVVLYRPNTKALDQNYDLKLSEDQSMNINGHDLLPGRWSVRITWKDGEKEFFSEGNIYITRL